jgi:acetyl esterase/lipase
MRELPRRLRWPAVGAVTVAAVVMAGFLVICVPPVLAGAIEAGSTAPEPAAASGSGGAAASEDARQGGIDLPARKTTLTYCHNGGSAETLDAYEPTPEPSAAVPAVVYVHGGGWTGGNSSIASDSLVGQVATAVEKRGWVFISINYRLAPRYRWPAQIDDATCAVRFLRAHADALHIESRHIGALGDSAGGQIVSLLGLAGSDADFDSGPYGDQSSAVQAVVDLYGPSDLTAADWLRSPVVEAVAPSVFGGSLGPSLLSPLEATLLTEASPVSYVGRHAPPFLIMQGDEDTVVPPGQSRELADQLRRAGNSPTLVMVRGAQHEFVPAPGGSVTPSVDQLAAQASAFLIRHLA